MGGNANIKIGRAPNFLFKESLIHWGCLIERKENPMTTAFAILFFVRVLLPVALLLFFGEWVRRREIRYWLNN
jgi:hypothetical protein